MVGCRHNAKNTLPKNYLHFAEKNGARVHAEVEVTDVRPLTFDVAGSKVKSQKSDARYEVTFRGSTKLFKQKQTVHARNVIFSAGVMGTMRLLLNLRDVKKSLPRLSAKLGTLVRTTKGLL
jgi:cholesterol oxidase